MRNTFFAAYFDKVIAGEKGDLAVCEALYGAMAEKLRELRAGKRSRLSPEQDVVISHIVCHRAVRDVLRRKFGPELECLVLITPREVLAERRMARIQKVAGRRGLTIDQLAQSYPGTGTTEERIAVAMKRCVPAEPLEENEERTYGIFVSKGMDEAAVMVAARARLGL